MISDSLNLRTYFCPLKALITLFARLRVLILGLFNWRYTVPRSDFIYYRLPSVYQLAFLTPGINPFEANSLNLTRDISNFRIYPRGLPSIRSRLCKRTGLESNGN